MTGRLERAGWVSLVLACIGTGMAGGALLLGQAGASLPPQPGGTTGCPVTGAGPWVRCVRAPDVGQPNVGQEITAGAGADPGTPWMVTDHSGAPMAWVNLYGLYSGGDAGKMPGGLICVTNGVAATVACLTPVGTLTLQPPGWRHPVTLTARDIRFLHRLERAR